MSRCLVLVGAIGLCASVASADVSVAAARQRAGGAPWLVLDGRLMLDEAVEDAWVKEGDEHERIDGDDEVVVRAPVDAKQLPARVRAWKGRKVRLGDERGEACTAEVTGFEVVVRGVDIDGAESSLSAWTWWEAGGTKFLAATLAKPAGCRRARWAWPAEEALPSVTAWQPADRALTQAALERLSGTDVYRAARRSFDEDFAGEDTQRFQNGGWGDPDARTVRVGVVRVRGATLVSASVRRAPLFHGGASYDAWALFRVDGDRLDERGAGELFVGSLIAVGDALVYDQAAGGSDFGVLRGRRFTNVSTSSADRVHGMP